MRTVKGFTLIELMVTLVVLAIAAAIAAPNFGQMIVRNQAESQRNNIVNALNLARSEAIKRGAVVSVAQKSGGWQNGWQVTAGSVVLRDFPALKGQSTLTSSQTQVSFDARGRLTGSGVSMTTNYTFAFRVGSDYCRVERDISINALGRVAVTPRTCS